MSKRTQRIDDRQSAFNPSLPLKVENLIQQKEEILEAMEHCPKKNRMMENEFELSVVIAAGIKRAITQSGFSREQVVDKINDYFGRSKAGAQADSPTCRNPLSIHMLNNYLSKPHSRPIPAYYLFAIHRVTRNLEPIRVIAEPEGAQIATPEDIRYMALGRLEAHMVQLEKLKKQLKKNRR